MQIGICVNMNAKDSDDLGLDQIEYCKDIGIEYIELSLDRIMMLNNPDFVQLEKRVVHGKLPCLACNNFIPSSVRVVGNTYNKEQFEAYIHMALPRAHALGARKIVFGSAGARTVPSDFPMEMARQQLLDRLNYIADVAELYEIEIEVEHLNRYECNIINTFEESVALAKDVKRFNVKSIFDYYHFALSGENDKLISQNEEWIGYMHFACTLGRHMPDIYDIQNLAPVLQNLSKCVYDDTFSLEAYFPDMIMNELKYANVISALKTGLTHS